MSKVKSFIKRKKVMIIVLSILLILAILIYNFISGMASAVSAVMSTPSISALVKQDLSNVIMASGNTSAVDSREVQASTSAAQSNLEVVSLNVQVGDTVQQGQVLATLDSTDAQESLESAQEDLADAYVGVDDAATQANFDLAVAQRSLTDAQNQYNIDKANFEQTVIDLEADISNAQKAYDNALIAQDAIIQAWLNTQSPAITNPTTEIVDKYNNLTEAEKLDPAHAATVALYNEYMKLINDKNTVINPLSSSLNSLKTSLDNEKAAYETKERSNSLSIESMRDKVVQTTMSDQTVDSAQTEYENSQDRLEDATQNLDDMQIRSPISGVVTHINVSQGDKLTGALCTVQNLNEMEIVTTVASYDVVKLQTGMKAEITTDSTADEVLDGVIHSISPIATDTSGNFEVIVRINESHANLRAGVPSKITFLIQESADVFAVPIDAVLEENGEQFVYVYDTQPTAEQLMLGEEDSRRKLVVTTGMESDYLVQIISDELVEGMYVMDDPRGLNVSSPEDMLLQMTTGAQPEGGPPAGGGGPRG